MIQVSKVLSAIFIITMIFSFGCKKTLENDKEKYTNEIEKNVVQKQIESKLVDNDGNIYNSVTIGTLEWMSKNLNVDHYRNGDLIPEVRDFTVWDTLKTGAWCYYLNDPEKYSSYGKLYNYYAVNDSRGLAPEGWHIPSTVEWIRLRNYLGGNEEAGGKLKDTVLWKNPNVGATNEYGFSAIPGGLRDYEGFDLLGEVCCFWSLLDSIVTSGCPDFYYLGYGYTNMCRSVYFNNRGMSVRCIKDYNKSIIKREDKNNYNYSNHNDFDIFWEDFKRAFNDDDTSAILKMTEIPFYDKSGDTFEWGGFKTSRDHTPGDEPSESISLTSMTTEEFLLNYKKIFNDIVKKTIQTATYQTFGEWEYDNYPVNKPGLYKINDDWFLLYVSYKKTDDTWIPAIILFGKNNGIFKMSHIPYQV